MLKAIFLITTTVVVFANVADALYFKFSKKRSGIEIFNMLSDESNPIGSYFTNYWPNLLVILGIVFLAGLLYVKGIASGQRSKRKWYFYLIIAVVWFFAARGSIGLKPLKTFDAARFVKASSVPVTVSTPFNLISSWQGSTLDEVSYFDDSTLNKIINSEKMFFDVKKTPLQPNVVVFILESFARDYVGFLRKKERFTPFLDSLSKKSLIFENAYSNGNISMHGLPAVLAGVPNYTDVPYINSSYQNNKVENLGALLGKINYQSHFYHGADNGTMGFQNFLKITGWQNYYGKNEYPTYEKDFDGSWGIFDGPYFDYFKNELDQKQEPFVASLFSLSSHDPYPLPEKHKDKYKIGKLPIHANIQYTDDMLRNFFDEAKKSDWYNNTIFVITADHPSHSKNPYFYTSTGNYEIPIMIFDPSQKYVKPAISYKTVNQIDILPTVLDIVNYPYPFFSLGESMLDSNRGYAYQRVNGVYQIISYPYVAEITPSGKYRFYKIHKEQTSAIYGLFEEEFEIRRTMLRRLLAFIQLHNKKMINNSFYLDLKN